ncbi:peptide/nickel transport system substrate-binding protein [Paenibacillus algorifonticola]|uniref:Peptide/nickel transport system substrate-binding protein n=1 Tax=Paenibacillus algorifonticola TaxID=684063 RepID=A0A1I2H1V3_9BACL|nr:ABC transporter substrate-binding protein [Paenibacillus algorifonticola]SFF23672.1 peptide/nickel transport system substrate-binding protein [Paenibacillus algorifonticola]
MKKNNSWKMVCALVSILSILTLSACSSSGPATAGASGGSEAKPAGESKVVNIGITNAPLMFNPIDQTDNTSIIVTSILFQPLMELDENLEFVPMLADSIETEDNQVYTVKLNENAKWSDGEPVTADDVVFTVKLIGNPKSIVSLSTRYAVLEGFDELGKLPEGASDVAGVKKIDDHTVEFRTKQPVDPNLFMEGFGKNLKPLPEHVLKDASPETLAQNPFFQKPTVVNGPFTFVTYAKDQYIELQANKDYFKGAPKLDKLNFKIMPSSNLVAQLQSGEIDMNFPGIGTISVQDFEKVKNMSNVNAVSGKPFNYQNLYFNNETITDVRVRHAIAYAINREMMIDNLLKGEGESMDVQYTPIHPYYNKNLTPITYNPEKAKELLKEAGWDSSKTLRLVVPSGNKTREQAADIIVENLKAVGINAQVQKFDLATSVQKLIKGEYDLDILGLIFILDPDLTTVFGTGSKTNYARYSSPEMDKLLLEGTKETDSDKRRVIYDKVQELIMQDLPQIALFADYRLLATNKRVLVGGPKDLGAFINVYEWDVEPK